MSCIRVELFSLWGVKVCCRVSSFAWGKGTLERFQGMWWQCTYTHVRARIFPCVSVCLAISNNPDPSLLASWVMSTSRHRLGCGLLTSLRAFHDVLWFTKHFQTHNLGWFSAYSHEIEKAGAVIPILQLRETKLKKGKRFIPSAWLNPSASEPKSSDLKSSTRSESWTFLTCLPLKQIFSPKIYPLAAPKTYISVRDRYWLVSLWIEILLKVI